MTLVSKSSLDSAPWPTSRETRDLCTDIVSSEYLDPHLPTPRRGRGDIDVIPLASSPPSAFACYSLPSCAHHLWRRVASWSCRTSDEHTSPQKKRKKKKDSRVTHRTKRNRIALCEQGFALKTKSSDC